jgi:hypothetical protein
MLLAVVSARTDFVPPWSARPRWSRSDPSVAPHQRLDRASLGEAGQALDQEVAVGEQADQHALDKMILAEHGFADPRLQIEQGLTGRWRGQGTPCARVPRQVET